MTGRSEIWLEVLGTEDVREEVGYEMLPYLEMNITLSLFGFPTLITLHLLNIVARSKEGIQAERNKFGKAVYVKKRKFVILHVELNT